MPTQQTLTGLDLDTSYTIRTAKRTTGHAAQLWGETGYWDLGVYPAKYLAENAARVFAATSPVEGGVGLETPAKWHPHRSDSHSPSDDCKWNEPGEKGHVWVRMVKGGAWQSRPWISGYGDNINLGIFTRTQYGESAEARAAALSRAFDDLWRGTTTVAQAVAALKNRPAHARVRVKEDIEIPESARDRLRPPPRVPSRVKRARKIARRFPRDLWGNAVTPGALIDGWAEAEEQRETYAAQLQLAIEQDAPNADRLAFDGLVEVSSEF